MLLGNMTFDINIFTVRSIKYNLIKSFKVIVGCGGGGWVKTVEGKDRYSFSSDLLLLLHLIELSRACQFY